MEPKVKEKIHAYIEYRGEQKYRLLIYMRWSTNVELTQDEVLAKIASYMQKMQQP